MRVLLNLNFCPTTIPVATCKGEARGIEQHAAQAVHHSPWPAKLAFLRYSLGSPCWAVSSLISCALAALWWTSHASTRAAAGENERLLLLLLLRLMWCMHSYQLWLDGTRS